MLYSRSLALPAPIRSSLLLVLAVIAWYLCHGTDLLEETDWFEGDLQQALGRLIAQGRIDNLDAEGKRKSRFLHYEEKNGERLQLTESKK